MTFKSCVFPRLSKAPTKLQTKRDFYTAGFKSSCFTKLQFSKVMLLKTAHFKSHVFKSSLFKNLIFQNPLFKNPAPQRLRGSPGEREREREREREPERCVCRIARARACLHAQILCSCQLAFVSASGFALASCNRQRLSCDTGLPSTRKSGNSANQELRNSMGSC